MRRATTGARSHLLMGIAVVMASAALSGCGGSGDTDGATGAAAAVTTAAAGAGTAGPVTTTGAASATSASGTRSSTGPCSLLSGSDIESATGGKVKVGGAPVAGKVGDQQGCSYRTGSGQIDVFIDAVAYETQKAVYKDATPLGGVGDAAWSVKSAPDGYVVGVKVGSRSFRVDATLQPDLTLEQVTKLAVIAAGRL